MNNTTNTNKTPAGFNTEKMTADAVASLVYNANDNISTAILMLIQTYKIGSTEAEKVREKLEAYRQGLSDVWEYINAEMRNLKG